MVRSAVSLLLLGIVLGIGVTGFATAASSSVTVTATVLSATYISTDPADTPAGNCKTATANRTEFGVVLPGASAVTASDCSVVFGSSNDTAMLRAYQADITGAAMFASTRGSFETAFDTDGIQTTPVGAGVRQDTAMDMTIQPDGKILTAGDCAMPGTDLCVARYTTAGILDTTFDTDGKQTTDFAASSDYGHAIAVQPDGKIIAAGGCLNGGSSIDFCIARYTSTGALDTTFDTDGKQLTTVSPGAGQDYVKSIAVQSDGAIIAAGYCDMGGATGTDFCVARYTSSGALDTTFDTDGIQTIAIGPGTNADTGEAVIVQSNGKIVMAGNCDMGGATGMDYCAIRLSTAGALDTSFDTDGIQTTAVGAGAATDSAASAILQPDGKIVLGGNCSMGAGSDMCLVRYLSTGALDTSFDTDGKATTSVNAGATEEMGLSVALQPDGGLAIAGRCDTGGGAGGRDFCIGRFTSTGAVDTNFDGDGAKIIAIGPGTGYDSGEAVATQIDGKLVIAGYCNMGATDFDLCVVSLDTGAAISQFAGGSADWTTGSNMFGACLRSVANGAATDGTTWAADGDADCADGNADPWKPIVTTSGTAGSKVASSPTTGVGNATANIRFGFKAASNQAPAIYTAPIIFETIAPNV